ncbi:solute carrier family 25 (mitochondrial citrate transporter), member 1 [Cryptococcus neoformans Bt85]|nr:solute carrier family 25 (mitochondrial citrate transporter), member 1 [Cryptococcus neoformans var. grubii Bt85]
MSSTTSKPFGGGVTGNRVAPPPPKATSGKEKVPLSTHLIAGGVAGLAEALACHPLDTIKVRMQLSKSRKAKGLKPLGFFATGRQIAARETPLGLYKGLGAVVSGIVPKMAIRFASFEMYKGWLSNPDGSISSKATFLAGLGAGATEAVAVVTPMEVVKIRLQAQQHSLADPLDIPRYRNAAHAAFTIVREEGIATLYRGVSLTALRQATNQGVNFTAYQQFKKWAMDFQPQHKESGQLPSWQTMILGLVSGAMGPFSNAPIDTIKTRIQKASKVEGETALSRMVKVTSEMFRNEGAKAFYKGITPRVLRVAPGQAIVFTVYERMKKIIDVAKGTALGAEYDE